jgi:hypothetical protein
MPRTAASSTAARPAIAFIQVAERGADERSLCAAADGASPFRWCAKALGNA